MAETPAKKIDFPVKSIPICVMDAFHDVGAFIRQTKDPGGNYVFS